MVQKKRWSDLSPVAKTGVAIGGVVEVVVTAYALRDIIRRPAGELRGWKLLWVLGFFVQPIGPLLYLRVGRRRSDS